MISEWKSESIDQLAAALVAAQADLHNAQKTTTNTFLNTKYADLATVREAIVEPFARHGLAVTQTFWPCPPAPGFDTVKKSKDKREYLVPTQVLGVLRTVLVHMSGQWMASELPIATAWGDTQTLGGAITYFRRYALAAIAGLAQEDDDGETARGHEPAPERREYRDDRRERRQDRVAARPPRPLPPPAPRDRADGPDDGDPIPVPTDSRAWDPTATPTEGIDLARFARHHSQVEWFRAQAVQFGYDVKSFSEFTPDQVKKLMQQYRLKGPKAPATNGHAATVA